MRTPMENGFGLDVHAAAVQHARTCRARCGRSPARRGRRRSARRPPASRRGCWRSASSIDVVHARAPKRYSPPSASILRADALDHRDQPEGADMRLADDTGSPPARRPRRTRSAACGQVARVLDAGCRACRRRRCRRRLRRTGRCISGFSTPRRHRPQVSRVRSRTSLPRSRMIGRNPISRQGQRGHQPARAGADDAPAGCAGAVHVRPGSGSACPGVGRRPGRGPARRLSSRTATSTA